MLKILKEFMLKQVKEKVMTMSHQRENNITVIKITKIADRNSRIKSAVTEMKYSLKWIDS